MGISSSHLSSFSLFLPFPFSYPFSFPFLLLFLTTPHLFNEPQVVAASGTTLIFVNISFDKEPPVLINCHQVSLSPSSLSSIFSPPLSFSFLFLFFLIFFFIFYFFKQKIVDFAWKYPFLYSGDQNGAIFETNVLKVKSVFYSSR